MDFALLDETLPDLAIILTERSATEGPLENPLVIELVTAELGAVPANVELKFAEPPLEHHRLRELEIHIGGRQLIRLLIETRPLSTAPLTWVTGCRLPIPAKTDNTTLQDAWPAVKRGEETARLLQELADELGVTLEVRVGVLNECSPETSRWRYTLRCGVQKFSVSGGITKDHFGEEHVPLTLPELLWKLGRQSSSVDSFDDWLEWGRQERQIPLAGYETLASIKRDYETFSMYSARLSQLLGEHVHTLHLLTRVAWKDLSYSREEPWRASPEVREQETHWLRQVLAGLDMVTIAKLYEPPRRTIEPAVIRVYAITPARRRERRRGVDVRDLSHPIAALGLFSLDAELDGLRVWGTADQVGKDLCERLFDALWAKSDVPLTRKETKEVNTISLSARIL